MIDSPVSANIFKSNGYFLIAFGLLNILSFTLLFCTIGFLCGATVSLWQLPLAIVSSLAMNYYAARYFTDVKGMAAFLRSSFAIAASLVFMILFCGYFYDVSYDGQWYHQETIYRLKEGYNPTRQNLAVPADEVILSTDTREWCTGADKPKPYPEIPGKPVINSKYLTINHFSKGIEIVETAFYMLTNRIETGKAVNGIALLSSLFLCLSVLYRTEPLSVRKKWLLAIILSFNPLTVIQLLTYCVDGALASIFLCLLAACALLFMDANRQHLLLLGSVIILAVNIKFTNLAYTVICCTSFLAALLAYKKIISFKKIFFTCMVSGLTGVFLCGYHPFITNYIQDRNLFYGLHETQDVINQLTPPLFRNLNRFEKLFLSVTAHQGWHSADKSGVWKIPKIPFTFNKEDIRASADAEQQLSGLGPFFSGALLVASLLFMTAMIYVRKSRPLKLLMCVFFTVLFTILIVRDCWWTRYVPQLWLLPVIILCMGEFMQIRKARILSGLLYFPLGLNIAWALLSVVSNLFVTVHMQYQIAQIKSLNQPIKIEYCHYDSYKSNKIRFYEHGILFTEEAVSGPYIYNVIGSNTRFETLSPLPELPKPFLLKLSEKINGKN